MPRLASLVVPAGLLWLSLYDVVRALAIPKSSVSTALCARQEDGVPVAVSSVSSLPMTPTTSISESANINTPAPFPLSNIEAVHSDSDTRIWDTNLRALLHLNSRASSDDPSTNDSGPTHSPGRAITGGVVGGLALIALIALIHFIWRRRRERRELEKLAELFSPRRPPGGMGASVRTQAEPPIAPARVRKSAGFTPSFEIRTPHGIMSSHPASFPSTVLPIITADVRPEEPIRALRHPTEVR